jgi:hypothetical protein
MLPIQSPERGCAASCTSSSGMRDVARSRPVVYSPSYAHNAHRTTAVLARTIELTDAARPEQSVNSNSPSLPRTRLARLPQVTC